MNSIAKTRIKLIALILFSTVFLFVRNIAAICALSTAVIMFSIVKIRRGSIQSRLQAIVGISLFVVFFQLLFNVTVPVQARLLIGAATAARLITLSVLVLVFTEMTSPSAIVSALSFLPSQMCLLVTISFSLLPAILQELSAIRIAQQARGFAPHGIHIVSSVVPVLIPLLNRTLTRAEHIAMVLQTRGFE